MSALLIAARILGERASVLTPTVVAMLSEDEAVLARQVAWLMVCTGTDHHVALAAGLELIAEGWADVYRVTTVTRPYRCTKHDDCRDHPQLGAACWSAREAS